MELLKVPVLNALSWSDCVDVLDPVVELGKLETAMKSAKKTVFESWISELESFWKQEADLKANVIRQFQELEESLELELRELEKQRTVREQEMSECSCQSTQLVEECKLLSAEFDSRLYIREHINECLQQLRTTCSTISDDVAMRKLKRDELHNALETLVATYRDRLGLNIRRVRGNLDDVTNIEFQFTAIDSNDIQRVFAFSLKLSPDKTFSITDCKPLIADMDVLLGRLNQTLDWHSFLVSVRQRFTQLVKQ